jgi:PAS domain S-box-containing protein
MINSDFIPDLFDKEMALLGILDSECKVIDVNDKALELVGLKKSDVLNCYFPDTAWWTWTNEQDRKMLVETLQNALLGQSSSFETSHIDIDGNEVRVLFMANPVSLGNGGRISVIGITELF